MARKKSRKRKDGNLHLSKDKLIVHHDPKSPVSEIYRSIRTNIQFSAFDKELKTLTVTSSIEGEGKTTTLCNLAVTLAQQNKRVLVVDADLRRPKVHRIFDIPNHEGLTELLISMGEPEKFIIDTFVENLFVLPTGVIPPNPAELLASSRMKHFIENVRAKFDYVLVDIPPINVVTDGLLVANRMDGVVLLCDSGRVSIEEAKKAKDQLINAKANVLGVVLNNVSQEGSAYYYYQ